MVGIATEPYKENAGFSLDYCCFEIVEWTDELEEMKNTIQEEYGYFVNPKFQHVNTNEYPQENEK